MDSGADITIMGGVLFKNVAAVTQLKKQDLKWLNKTSQNYDHTPFTLDGQIDMDLTFDGKPRAHRYDQLLSEGVCCQRNIHYHPSVERRQEIESILPQRRTPQSSICTNN